MDLRGSLNPEILSNLADNARNAAQDLGEQRRLLNELRAEVNAIRRTQIRTPKQEHPSADKLRRAKAENDWLETRRYKPASDIELLRKFVTSSDTSLANIFNRHQPWEKWNYRLAYTKLAVFVDGVPLKARLLKSRLTCTDLHEGGGGLQLAFIPSQAQPNYEQMWLSSFVPFYKEANDEEIWRVLRNRFSTGQGEVTASTPFTVASRPKLVKFRVLSIVGLTQTMAAMSIAVCIHCVLGLWRPASNADDVDSPCQGRLPECAMNGFYTRMTGRVTRQRLG